MERWMRRPKTWRGIRFTSQVGGMVLPCWLISYQEWSGGVFGFVRWALGNPGHGPLSPTINASLGQPRILRFSSQPFKGNIQTIADATINESMGFKLI
jgi:hypothetical protein